jgi:hypothetical protein
MTRTPSDNPSWPQGQELLDKIIDGIHRGRYLAVREALIHGTTLVGWKDGKIEEIDPRTIPLPPEFRPGYYEGPEYHPPVEK